MLHIILSILKVIGIILLLLLAIVVLLLILVMFVPVRYKADGYKHDSDMAAHMKITWLLHVLSVKLFFEKKELGFDIKVFGISLEKILKFLKRFSHKKNTVEDELKDAPAHTGTGEDGDPEANVKDDSANDSTAISKSDADLENCEENQSNFDSDILTGISVYSRKKKKTKSRARAKQARNSIPALIAYRILTLISKLIDLIEGILSAPSKIITALGKFFGKVSSLSSKVGEWKSFISDDRTKSAIRHMLGLLKRLLGHMFPKRLRASASFGFEDVSLTGMTMAAICAVYPMIGGYDLKLEPVFDREVLDGEVDFSGRIFMCVVTRCLVSGFFDKNIRFVIKKFR